MNHELNDLEPSQPNTSPSPAAREPYATPRLTNYGRFQHITGTIPASVADDEAVFADGDV